MSTIKIIDLESNSFKTVSIRKEDVQKRWFLVDASDQNLGRMCSKVAKILRGKHKPSFTPHVDCGDNVIIINASKINLTGKNGLIRNILAILDILVDKELKLPNKFLIKTHQF